MFKKLISLVAIFVFMMVLSTGVAFAERTIDIDKSEANQGTLKVLYHNSDVTKAKLLISKDGQKTYYNLSNSNEYDVFSLQLGNGDYQIAIYENVYSTKYRKVYDDTVSVTIKEEDKTNIYVKANSTVRYTEESKAAKLAKELTKDAKSDEEKAKIIHDYIIENITYDYNKAKKLSSSYVPDIDAVLADGKGICYDYAAVYAGMLRSVGVQVKLIKGYSAVTTAYHAWNQVYLDGRWVIVDATYDSFMVQNGYSYNFEKSAKYYTTDKEF